MLSTTLVHSPPRIDLVQHTIDLFHFNSILLPSSTPINRNSKQVYYCSYNQSTRVKHGTGCRLPFPRRSWRSDLPRCPLSHRLSINQLAFDTLTSKSLYCCSRYWKHWKAIATSDCIPPSSLSKLDSLSTLCSRGTRSLTLRRSQDSIFTLLDLIQLGLSFKLSGSFYIGR